MFKGRFKRLSSSILYPVYLSEIKKDKKITFSIRVNGIDQVIIFKSQASMKEEKLIGYIKGEIDSESEIPEVLDWIESTPELQKTYRHLKSLWFATGLENYNPLARQGLNARYFSVTYKPTSFGRGHVFTGLCP